MPLSHALLPVALLALALGACRSSDSPSAEPADAAEPQSESAATVDEPATVDEGSAETDVDVPAEPDPTVLASTIRQAVAEDDLPALEAALRELGRHLADWRARPQPELAAALRVLSTSEGAALRDRLDARYAPPAVEMLVDAGDWGAVARLTAAWEGSAADAVLAGPRRLANERPTSVTLALGGIDPSCSPTVDGATVEGDRAAVVSGSHLVGCADGDTELVVVARPGETVTISGDHRGLIVTR